jgi:hypothetical protein
MNSDIWLHSGMVGGHMVMSSGGRVVVMLVENGDEWNGDECTVVDWRW